MANPTMEPVAGGGEVPFPSFPPSLPNDGGPYPSAPPGYTESFGRATYQAVRIGTALLIIAEGDLPDLNQIADIRQLPLRIYPPQFGMFFYTPHITLPVVRHFRFTKHFGFPENVSHVTIHDLDGTHQVLIKDVKAPALPLLDSKAQSNAVASTNPVSLGIGASLQDALDHAVAALPASNPKIPDGFVVYTILEAGRLRGGIAGIDRHYAKVEARFGTSGP
jgi:hypothetical protein